MGKHLIRATTSGGTLLQWFNDTVSVYPHQPVASIMSELFVYLFAYCYYYFSFWFLNHHAFLFFLLYYDDDNGTIQDVFL